MLKFSVPVGLGMYLLWDQYNELSEDQKAELFLALREANYFWVFISILCGLLSHISRAYRWKYMLNHMGYYPRFMNSFYSVMIGYFFNLLVPRMGEVSRCGFMTKYEKIPLEKALGTVVAERVADSLILLSIIGTLFLLQLEQLMNVIASMGGGSSEGKMVGIAIKLSVVVIIGGILLTFIFRSEHRIALKIKQILRGLWEGMISILKMKDRWSYIGHTLFIWMMYIATFYVCLYSIEGVGEVSFIGAMTTFVAGSITVVISPGGIGFYQKAVQASLVLYGISLVAGLAVGWIMWLSQIIMLIFFGVLSLILIPLYNKGNEKQ